MRNLLPSSIVVYLALSIFAFGSCKDSEEIAQKSTSMHPTIKAGESFLISPEDPSKVKRGEIWVFERNGNRFVSRVVALAGDVISLKGDQIEIRSGNVNTEYPVLLDPKGHRLPMEISSDSCYVIGDNFSSSLDSRFFGEIPIYSLVGKYERLK